MPTLLKNPVLLAAAGAGKIVADGAASDSGPPFRFRWSATRIDQGMMALTRRGRDVISPVRA